MGATEPSWQVKSGHHSQADWGIFGRAPAVRGIWGLQEPHPVQGIFVYRSPSSLSIFCRRVQAAGTSLEEPKQSRTSLAESKQSRVSLEESKQSGLSLEEPKQSGTSLSGRAEAVRHILVWKSPSSLGHLWMSAQAVWSIFVWKRAQGG